MPDWILIAITALSAGVPSYFAGRRAEHRRWRGRRRLQ